jgi:AraC-like DNA-binding protein
MQAPQWRGVVRLAGFGQFIFWEDGSVYIGSSVAPSEMHSHHAIQLSLGLQGEVEFRRSGADDWQGYAGAVIPPDLPHTFQAPGRLLTHVFCQPESLVGRRVLARFGRRGISALEDSEAQALAAPLKAAYLRDAAEEELVAIARQTFHHLVGATRPEPDLDVRLRRALGEIAGRLDAPLTLPEIAAHVGLSEGRFRHLFVNQVGVPYRAYILWARLNRALALGYSGASWTDAAHAAGFADSAHLTRTCRRTFGIAPTAIADDGKHLTRSMSA